MAWRRCHSPFENGKIRQVQADEELEVDLSCLAVRLKRLIPGSLSLGHAFQPVDGYDHAFAVEASEVRVIKRELSFKTLTSLELPGCREFAEAVACCQFEQRGHVGASVGDIGSIEYSECPMCSSSHLQFETAD